MKPVLKIQDVYGDFLRSFKVFLDKVTGQTLNKIEWNYGSKTLEYYYMMDNHESFEYPVALVEIQDIQPIDSVTPIAMTAYGHKVSPRSTLLAENNTLNQQITVDKRWINLMFTVTINTEDVTSMLNYHYMFLQYMPLNFMVYDYKYWSYLEITPLIYNEWDLDNDDITNAFIYTDPTYRYPADLYHNQAPDPAFHTEVRDRVAAGDDYPIIEGERYFAQLYLEPIIKLTNITKQTEKENNQHSLILNFEAQMEIPQVLMRYQDYLIESIEVVIDPVGAQPAEFPILIDMPENFMTNKNIQRGILVLSDNFILPDPEMDPPEDPYLEIKTDINLTDNDLALWAVEDVSDVSSKRFFIPLEHATVERIEVNGEFESLHFYFDEMDWFYDFNFGPLSYMKMILFRED